MKIIFMDGKEIEFKRFGEIWLAESVIWEKTELHGSVDELRELKAKITKWFEENAPREASSKLKVRLPLWEEIEPLSFKDQVAFREKRADQAADYFLGDEDVSHPWRCNMGISVLGFSWCYHGPGPWSTSGAVRLCLEER